MEQQVKTPLQRYYIMMTNYRSGKYGNKHLALHQILEISGNANLFNEMNIEELSYLRDKSFGIQKLLFSELINRKNGNVPDNRTDFNIKKKIK